MLLSSRYTDSSCGVRCTLQSTFNRDNSKVLFACIYSTVYIGVYTARLSPDNLNFYLNSLSTLWLGACSVYHVNLPASSMLRSLRLFEALLYKRESLGFDSRLNHWNFSSIKVSGSIHDWAIGIFHRLKPRVRFPIEPLELFIDKSLGFDSRLNHWNFSSIKSLNPH